MRRDEAEGMGTKSLLVRFVRRFTPTALAASKKQKMDPSCPATTDCAVSPTDFIFSM